MADVRSAAESVFRRESGRIVASLIRISGSFDRAEEAMQEAFAAALASWPVKGTPDNPGAWIMTAARRKLIDAVRKERTILEKRDSLKYEAEMAGPTPDAEFEADVHFPDDRLRLIFTCCHPALNAEAQVALTLRTLGGLSTPEIAKAFLLPEATLAQRLVRAKRKIQEARIPYEAPPPDRLPERLAAVQAIIYLIFNEGYAAASGTELVRNDLCAAAIGALLFQRGEQIMRWTIVAAMLCAAIPAGSQTAGQEPPRSWIDADTGHRVVRLTDEPGSASLYFNQNGYTADGRKMVYTTPEGISALDLATNAAKSVVTGRVRVIVAGRRTPNVYYTKDNAVYSTNVDTGVTREIAKLPPRGSVATVNADETLMAGTYIEGDGPDYNPNRPQQPQQLVQPANKGQMMEERLAARLPMALFTINTKTGETKVLHRATDWLNHLEFSSTDPSLLMFCHEGPWHKVDRIWTMRTDGSHITLVHHRTMTMEIAGHEFWSADGKTIWYDLQTPRSEVFWLAGYNVETGARTWYRLERNEWSIHFNVTRDGKLFCGDGGDKGQVAHAPDGQWIYLFRPELAGDRGTIGKDLIAPGVLHAEKLVNMAKHQYKLEPNVSFTPDQNWVVFRSNMFGATYAFAVEVEKAAK